jgi:nitrogen fixation NifU-like protein
MSGLDALYQDVILDHSKRRIGYGLAEETEGFASATSHQRNPVCGDDITLRVRLEGDVVRDVTWEGAGCAISQSSASMLASLIAEEDGMPRAEASALVDGFREALRSRGTIALDEEVYSDAAALSGVSKYTARVKCAMLAWVAFEDALGRA